MIETCITPAGQRMSKGFHHASGANATSKDVPEYTSKMEGAISYNNKAIEATAIGRKEVLIDNKYAANYIFQPNMGE